MHTSFRDVETQSEPVRVPLHENLVGESKAMQEARDFITRLAGSSLTVLITGESGTGKDIAARLLHNRSPRMGKHFIKVNCPAIPESILESELFGYERGAFTGARTSKPGRFELAHNGTIFLDEITEISYNIQAKLLQVLDGEPFIRIGGVTPIETDVRIVAATNVELEEAVQQGKMREDIYYRLSEVHVRMPALRERPEDIPQLAEHFNYHFSTKQGRPYEPLAPALLARIQELPWPGNVRELAARIRKFVATDNPDTLFEQDGANAEMDGPPARMGRVVASSSESAVHVDTDAETTPETVPKVTEFVPLKEAVRKAVEATERSLIEEALRQTLWNRRKAAKLLNISYSSLLRRMDAYGIGKGGRQGK